IRQLLPLAPAALDHLLLRCLAKDPEQRWQSAADLAHELKWIDRSPSEIDSSRADIVNRHRERWFWAAAVLVASIASGTGVWLLAHSAPSRAAAITRAVVPLASVQSLT